MRVVTRGAAFNLQRRVFEDKRALLIRVAFVTRRIGASREACLLQLESTMRVVTIAALHRAFEHPVVERPGELRLRLVVAGHAQLRLVSLQHSWRVD